MVRISSTTYKLAYMNPMEYNQMKVRLFCKLSLLLISVLLPQSVYAQDYARWGLPEGATARLGKGSISDVAYSPDGERLAVASSIGIWIYNAHNGAEIDLLTVRTSWVESVAFSSDGFTLYSGSGDGTVRLWDAVTGAHKRTLKVSGDCVAISPDGRTLAVAGNWPTYAIRLWDVVSDTHKQTLEGHMNRVTSIVFSPDGGTLASASGETHGVEDWETTIRLWNAVSGEHMRTLEGHTFAVNSVAFSPDGGTIASGSNGQYNPTVGCDRR